MINFDVVEWLEDLGNKSVFVNDVLWKVLG